MLIECVIIVVLLYIIIGLQAALRVEQIHHDLERRGERGSAFHRLRDSTDQLCTIFGMPASQGFWFLVLVWPGLIWVFRDDNHSTK